MHCVHLPDVWIFCQWTRCLKFMLPETQYISWNIHTLDLVVLHFPRNWPVVRGMASCAGNSPVTGELPAQKPVTRSFAVFFDLRLNKRVNNREAGDLRRHRGHYDVIVIKSNDRMRFWLKIVIQFMRRFHIKLPGLCYHRHLVLKLKRTLFSIFILIS